MNRANSGFRCARGAAAAMTGALLCGLVVGCTDEPRAGTTPPPPTPATQGPAVQADATEVAAPAAAGACPVEQPRTVRPEVGPAIGAGPAYFTGIVWHFAVGGNAVPAGYESWGAAKTIVSIAGAVSNPDTVVISGVDNAGRGRVAFQRESVEPTMTFTQFTGANAWISEPVLTLVSEPGCYTLHIDGSHTHERVTFEVVFCSVDARLALKPAC